MKKGDVVIAVETGIATIKNKHYIVYDVLYCEYCGFQYVNLDCSRTTTDNLGECIDCGKHISTRNLRWVPASRVQVLSENRRLKLEKSYEENEI